MQKKRPPLLNIKLIFFCFQLILGKQQKRNHSNGKIFCYNTKIKLQHNVQQTIHRHYISKDTLQQRQRRGQRILFHTHTTIHICSSGLFVSN